VLLFLEGDRLGRLKITMDGMQQRDAKVFDWCRQRQLPVVFAMAGGYGVDITQTVAVQCNTFAQALAVQAA
jgi:acetoin utilization deacetylase AcuC-like enzyme